MPLILSVETGTDICSVALAQDREIISLIESDQGKNHAQNLGLFMNDIFNESGISAEQLDAVAVGAGPGSYTGLRIGVSIAKGICYANSIPLIAVNSLAGLAVSAIEDYNAEILGDVVFENALLVPMIDARNMEVYTQVFNAKGEALSRTEAKVITPESFAEYGDTPLILFGNGAKKCLPLLSERNTHYVEVAPSARGIVPLALQKFKAEQFEDLAYFEPLYLKNFVGTKSKKNIFREKVK